MSAQRRSASGRGRTLQLKARAVRQQETRRRIVQAAVELHTAIGPIATTISAIADRAGVQRLTVYRHFPDERSLFDACTQHFFAANPPPDPSAWMQIADPRERFVRGLTELYAYFNEHDGMILNVWRDYRIDPERVGHGLAQFLDAARSVLAKGWKPPSGRRKRLHAAIAHAVSIETWASLVREQALTVRDAVEFMTGLVSHAITA